MFISLAIITGIYLTSRRALAVSLLGHKNLYLGHRNPDPKPEAPQESTENFTFWVLLFCLATLYQCS